MPSPSASDRDRAPPPLPTPGSGHEHFPDYSDHGISIDEFSVRTELALHRCDIHSDWTG